MRRVLVTIAALTFLVLIAGIVAVRAQEPDRELAKLHHQWAMRYLEPAPHMELARYFKQKGNLIQAFYVLENARRYRFEEKVFDEAFLKYFGGFAPLDNSKAEEDKYLALVKASPNDVGLLTRLADVYVSRSEYTLAVPLFKKVLAKEPQNYTAVAALAEIYRRQNTPEKAKQITDDFVDKFPETADGYGIRIERLLAVDQPGARKLIDEAIKQFPNEGSLWFLSGLLAENDKNIDEAEACYVKAAELEKNAKPIQARAAIFFRVHRKDNQRAIKYYLNTYFLDPHAHFDGHAEAKVSSLNADIAEARVEAQLSSNMRAEALLTDPNPMVVLFALSKIAKTWDSTSPDLFIRMMRHDDVLVRWAAMQTIRAKVDASFDTRLRVLLQDPDLRVRGLAAYIAVSSWKEKSFPEIRRLLVDHSQLIRFDALSALLLYGGAQGKKIAQEHKVREPNETLRKLINIPRNGGN
jgi:tetratricopeptide (TPR) repeat protein